MTDESNFPYSVECDTRPKGNLMQVLSYKKLHPDGRLSRGTEFSSGLDLCATTNVCLQPHITEKISTGIAVSVPEGYVGLVRDRSSLGVKGIVVSGGVIDSDYRGEIFVCLTLVCHGRNDLGYLIHKGDRIAQLLIVLCPLFPIAEVEELPDTKRDDKGFGSTGK